MKDQTPSDKLKKSFSIRNLILVFADIVSVIVAHYLALLVRFDFRASQIPQKYLDHMGRILPFVIGTYVLFYVLFHLYRSIWRYASITEAYYIVLAYLSVAGATLIETGIFWAIGTEIPRGVTLMGYILSLFFCIMVRFSYRIGRFARQWTGRKDGPAGQRRVLVIGAGQAARELISDFRAGSHTDYRILAFIDDDPGKKGRLLEGIPIFGNRYDIGEAVEKFRIDTIIYAIPSAPKAERAEILNLCKETDCKLLTVPGIFQIVSGEVAVNRLREVSIDDLLGRKEVRINLDEIKAAIAGKVVLVTGGGGSIGSELCRQIASAGPKQLIIFDIYENNAYAIQQELEGRYGPSLDLVTLIGSCRNTSRISSVIRTYRPDVIYHAAAHKHVPLMENSPGEAVKNNVFGTLKTALAAAENGVSRFLLISTDKAVNPTSAMGTTKRICEMIIQMLDRKFPETTFMAVRFGNVLGSNGSVIPLFKKEIAEGGPVTVTDKNIIRYFMTIPEAVSLVLEASHYAKGGEIFVLDMGEPVRIDDLARNLIRLSNLEPDVDIPIVYTGLRPGEKLYEELLMDEEGMRDTPNKLIHIGHPIEMDDSHFIEELKMLDTASKGETPPMEMKKLLSEVVPTYRPDLTHADQDQGGSIKNPFG